MDLHWMRVPSDNASREHVHKKFRENLADQYRAGDWVAITVDGSGASQASFERLADVVGGAAELSSRAQVAVVLAGFDRRVVDAVVGEVNHGRFLLIDQPGRGRWCGASVCPCAAEFVSDVLDLLHARVAEHLQGVLEHGGPGINRGLYRTPTLQVTDRWVAVDTLLRECVGTATAAFLIAHRMAGVPSDAQVLRVATVTMELAEAVAKSSGAKANADVIIDEFDSSSEELQRLKDGTPVILCTDLILTENSAKRAVAEVLNWHAVPIMVVTAFDARKHAGWMVLRDTKIPVISLVRINVTATVGPRVAAMDIDPVLRSVVTPRRRIERAYPWDPPEFLTACSGVERAVTIGHTGRVAHRHFTINFDFGRLIADSSPLRQQIVDRMAIEIVRYVTDAKTVVICHPDHAEEYAGRLARLVAEELARRLPGIALPMLPVPRAVLGSRWVYPDGLDAVPPGCDVVIVDWGSVEAVSIHQLIRLAAEAGAGRILSLVLMSQLQKYDERALTMIKSVEGVRPTEDDEVVAVEIPTRVRFVTALGISAVPPNKCPLCQLVKQLEDDARGGGLPLIVQRHVEKLAATLQVRTRAEVASSPLDAFGTRTETVATYVRLRLRLLDAMRDTAVRQQVAGEITALAENGDRTARHAVVSLLAAERQWLTMPPLRFANCREAVAELAVRVALEIDSRRRLRLQALIVLAKAAPEILVREAPRLWQSFSGNSLLVLHLIYHLHRISQRTRGDVPVELPELREQITACKVVLGKHPFRASGFTEEL